MSLIYAEEGIKQYVLIFQLPSKIRFMLCVQYPVSRIHSVSCLVSSFEKMSEDCEEKDNVFHIVDQNDRLFRSAAAYCFVRIFLIFVSAKSRKTPQYRVL